MSRQISSLAEMLNELTCMERSSELLVELEYTPDTPESLEAEFPGEARRRKIAQGILRAFQAEYVVEGLVRIPLLVQ